MRRISRNDATDKGTDVEQYQGVVRETINAEFQNKSNKEEERQLVPNDNSENLENKGKSIEAARRGVGKDGVLGSPNVVAVKQDNFIA
ncbi:hypothetical protein KY290_000634 [Solanum tuberosum]|uniref:Uncharacterized protein n=1 Tax=Solanum tuberosum TaxID=4113 RepID=A0ABQ7WLB3_SOLTU|nr:hypothetical protein KY289_000701 [Solanum tuberosum]KAH0781036.1 hypothetical protein KY290_000634 [Solanum tuberosum]